MLGSKRNDFQFIRRTAEDGYAIEVPVFSFDKFPNVDKSLGPEMKSTGEAIYFIKDLKEEPAPSGDAGFYHCETRLCGAWQRQVYRERSMYLSR